MSWVPCWSLWAPLLPPPPAVGSAGIVSGLRRHGLNLYIKARGLEWAQSLRSEPERGFVFGTPEQGPYTWRCLEMIAVAYRQC